MLFRFNPWLRLWLFCKIYSVEFICTHFAAKYKDWEDIDEFSEPRELNSIAGCLVLGFNIHDPLIRHYGNMDKVIPLGARGLDKENSPDIPSTDKAMSLGAQSLNEVTSFDIRTWDKASSLDIQTVRKVLSLYVWGIKRVVSLSTRRTAEHLKVLQMIEQQTDDNE